MIKKLFMLGDISALFERDLNRLIKEIQSYDDEATLWKIEPGISNSAGNLTLHLIGNLNHFLGKGILNSGYVRERDKEFSDKNVPREKLISDVREVIMMIKNAMNNFSVEDLEKNFPIEINNTTASAHRTIMHLYGHLNYHLGQINYHRRLLS
ncbi:MAG: DUF1572 family protein [Ginsengibacter sp.]